MEGYINPKEIDSSNNELNIEISSEDKKHRIKSEGFRDDYKLKLKNLRDFQKLEFFIKNSMMDMKLFVLSESSYTYDMAQTEDFIILSQESGNLLFIKKNTGNEVLKYMIFDRKKVKYVLTTCLEVHNSLLLCGSNTGVLTILETKNVPGIDIITQIKAHTSPIKSIKVSNIWIYTVSKKLKMEIWKKNLLIKGEEEDLSRVISMTSEPSIFEIELCEKFAFMICKGKKIKVWKQQDFLQTSEVTPFTVIHDNETVISVVKANGDYLYTASADGNIKVYDIDQIRDEKDRLLTILKRHSKSVTNLNFDEYYMYSCSLDQTIKIWDIESLTKPKKFSQNLICSLSCKVPVFRILVDDDNIFYKGKEGDLISWAKKFDDRNIEDDPLKVINKENNMVFIRFLSKNVLLGVDFRNIFYLWDLKEINLNEDYLMIDDISECQQEEGFINEVEYKEGIVMSVTRNTVFFSKINFENEKSPEIKYLGKFKSGEGRIGSVGFFKKDMFLIGNFFGGFQIYQYSFTDSNEIEFDLINSKNEAHTTCIKSIKAHENLIFTGSENSNISVWEYNKLGLITFKKFLVNTGEIGHMEIHPDGNYLFVCCAKEVKSCINVWNLKKKVEEDIQPLKVIQFEKQKPSDIVINAEKNLIYFSTYEGAFGAFNLVKPVYLDNEPIFCLKADEENTKISKICLTQDKNILVTASKQVKFWNCDERQMDLGSMLQNDIILLNNLKKIFQILPRSDLVEISTGTIHHLKKFYAIHQVTSKPFFEIYCCFAIEEVIEYYLNVIGLGTKYDQIENLLEIIRSINISLKTQSINLKRNAFLNKDQNYLLSRTRQKRRRSTSSKSFNQRKKSVKKNMINSIMITLKYLTENKNKVLGAIKDSTIYQILELSHLKDLSCVNFIHSYLHFKLKEVKGQRKVKTCVLKNDIEILRPQTEKLLSKSPKTVKKIVFFNTGFKINLIHGSKDSRNLFKIINRMSDRQLIDIAPLISSKFKIMRKFFVSQFVSRFISAVIVNFSIYLEDRHGILFIIGAGTLVSSIYYEFMCFLYTQDYFKIFSNYVDIFIYFGGIFLMFNNYVNFYEKTEVLTFSNLTIMTLLNLRTFSFLRAFKGFRYLINMIVKAFIEIRYFLSIIIVFLFINVAVLYGKEQINFHRGKIYETKGFVQKMTESVKLSFGELNFPEIEEYTYSSDSLDWIIFIPNSITIANILLNLIIAIVWDVYAVYKKDRNVIDLKIKIELIQEMEGYLSFLRRNRKPKTRDYKYLQYVVELTENDEKRLIDQKLIQQNDHLHAQVENLEKRLDDKIEMLEDYIFEMDRSMKMREEYIKDSIHSMEKKIGGISSLGGKIEEIYERICH